MSVCKRTYIECLWFDRYRPGFLNNYHHHHHLHHSCEYMHSKWERATLEYTLFPLGIELQISVNVAFSLSIIFFLVLVRLPLFSWCVHSRTICIEIVYILYTIMNVIHTNILEHIHIYPKNSFIPLSRPSSSSSSE